MLYIADIYSFEEIHSEIEKIIFIEDKEEGGFVAFYPDLPGCITCGETVEIAVANALDAKKAWIEAMMEEEH